MRGKWASLRRGREMFCVCVSALTGVVLVVKNLPANAWDMKDAGLIPELGRSPGEGHSNPLQYSCLENPVDRGAWRAMIHRVTKSRARLKQLSMHAKHVWRHICVIKALGPWMPRWCWQYSDLLVDRFPLCRQDQPSAGRGILFLYWCLKVSLTSFDSISN